MSTAKAVLLLVCTLERTLLRSKTWRAEVAHV